MATPKGSPAERICRALTELRAIRMEEPPKSQIALYAGYSDHTKSTFKNAVSSAKKAGYIEYPADKNTLRLSEAGLQSVPDVQPPQNNADMLARLHHALKLKKAPAKVTTILDLLSDGQEHTLVSVAESAGYPDHTKSTFKNAISTISTLQILDRTVKGVDGSVRLNDVAFPCGRSGELTTVLPRSTTSTVADRMVAPPMTPKATKRKAVVTPSAASKQQPATKKKKKAQVAVGVEGVVKVGNLGAPKKGGVVDRLCTGLAELRAIGIDEPSRGQVAIFADYPSADTAGFKKAAGEAKKGGYIEYSTTNTLRLSSAGRNCVPNVEPPKNNAEMLERLQSAVEKKKAPKKASAMLLDLLSNGKEHTLKAVAEATDYPSHTTAGFKKFISIISSLEIIERPVKGLNGTIMLGDIAFPYGRNNEAGSFVKHEGQSADV